MLDRHGCLPARRRAACSRPRMRRSRSASTRRGTRAPLAARHIGDSTGWCRRGCRSPGPTIIITRFADLRGRAIIAASAAPAALRADGPERDPGRVGRRRAWRACSPIPARASACSTSSRRGSSPQRAEGVFFDFESLPPSAQANYLAFLREAHARCARRGWQLAIAVPVGDNDWNLRAYAAIVDRAVPDGL